MGRKYYLDPQTGEKIYIRDKVPSLKNYRKSNDQDIIDNQIKESIDEKITAPNITSVGQTIRVKTADESGKPIEWEAVDMPSGDGKIVRIELADYGLYFGGENVSVPQEFVDILRDALDNRKAPYVHGAVQSGMEGTILLDAMYTINNFIFATGVGVLIDDGTYPAWFAIVLDQENLIASVGYGLLEGQNGADGFSPIINVSRESDKTILTITDAYTTNTVEIPNGKQGPAGADGAPGVDGQDGAPGADGADGISPTVELVKESGVTTMTVTDAAGTHSTEIMDGADGVSPVVQLARSDAEKKTTLTITDAEGVKTADIPDGATGPKGDQGVPGYPPKLSSDGTWMVWDAEAGAYTDTGVKAFYGDSMPTTGTEDAGKVLTVTEAGVPGWMLPSQGDWKTLVDVTTEEDASRFTFQFDDVSELIIMISGTATNPRINFFSDGITNFYHYRFLMASKESSNYLHVHKRIGGMRYMESGTFSEETPDRGNSYALLDVNEAYGKLVRSVKDSINNLRFDLNASYILQSGARIQIFGR